MIWSKIQPAGKSESHCSNDRDNAQCQVAFTTDLWMKTGAGQHIKYSEQVFLHTEFMCLVISLDRLLAIRGSNFLSGDAFI